MTLTFDHLKALLAKHDDYLLKEADGTLDHTNPKLNTTLLHKLAQVCDETLLALLAQNTDAREKFFLETGGYQVFVRDIFIDYISHKHFLANSYTKYKNKIGLSDGVRFIKQTNEVVLDFPFKDCVLEGGQSKDDEKRGEVYFNETLAGEEIDRLLDPKALTNAKRITQEGETPTTHFNRNARGTITDNLIIKGNNLIALHTLKAQFAGKVKLIYIDPPYNTGNDSFNYNDNFSHSTWLLFMKNRLEAARELLREDGVIFVQCDDNEQAYLKVLMDEVFGRENFRNLIFSKIGTKSVQNQFDTWDKLSNGCDFILFYSRLGAYRMPKAERIIAMKEGAWNNHWRSTGRPTMRHEIFGVTPEYGQWRWSESRSLTAIESYSRMLHEIGEGTEVTQCKIDAWYLRQEQATDLLRLSKNGKPEHYIPPTDKQPLNNVWMDIKSSSHSEIERLFKSKAFTTPKPENLMQRIIDISTQPGDLVLDYHLGSGTTAAVVHKMGRQYIGVEQMDYIETVALARMKKVIGTKTPVQESLMEQVAYDTGGISKAVNWHGGGECVYLELKAYNQTYVKAINNASSSEALLAVRTQIIDKGFIDYRLRLETIKNDNGFSNLSLLEQKKLLLAFLDKNQLYLPFSERHDSEHACTDDEIALSEDFYNHK